VCRRYPSSNNIHRFKSKQCLIIMGAEDQGWTVVHKEDSYAAKEHRALIDFAERLGSSISKNEAGIADEPKIRLEAKLLMSLLSSNPHMVTYETEALSSSSSSTSSSSVNDQYSSDSSLPGPYRRESFRFSCPSLSLDSKRQNHGVDVDRKNVKKSTGTSGTDDGAGIPPPPADLFSRALKVDDRDASRLSAEAMARNLLLSFQRALRWRIEAWCGPVSSALVRKERALVMRKASEDEIKGLLRSREAQLLLVLREAGQKLDVLHARTRFNVLPHKVRKNVDETQPRKKSRVSETSELLQFEPEYQYSVAHSLRMEGTISLCTPVGHSEIDLEVPGVVQGTFLSSEPGIENLIAIDVELDTDILASMVEKSCRIIVRSSVEKILADMGETYSITSPPPKTSKPVELGPPFCSFSSSSGTFNPRHMPVTHTRATGATIVTPRKVSPTAVSNLSLKPVLFSIPDDLDHEEGKSHRVMIQPNTSDHSDITFTPRTPRKAGTSGTHSGVAAPSMVSPMCVGRKGPQARESVCMTTTTGKRARRTGPNLPVLVEVACAAMRDSS